MAYINPGQLIAPYMTPMSDRFIQGIGLANQQRELDARLPYLEAQAAVARENAAKAKQVRDIYNQLMGGNGAALPASGQPIDQTKMIDHPFVRSYLGLPQASYDTFTEYGDGGQTRRVNVPKGQNYTPQAGWSLSAPKEAKSLQRGSEKVFNPATGQVWEYDYIFDPASGDKRYEGKPRLVGREAYQPGTRQEWLSDKGAGAAATAWGNLGVAGSPEAMDVANRRAAATASGTQSVTQGNPANMMNQMRYDAMARINAGQGTPQDFQLLHINTNDPFFKMAWDMTMNDPRSMQMTPQEQVANAANLTGLIRTQFGGAAGQAQPGQPGAQTGAPMGAQPQAGQGQYMTGRDGQTYLVRPAAPNDPTAIDLNGQMVTIDRVIQDGPQTPQPAQTAGGSVQNMNTRASQPMPQQPALPEQPKKQASTVKFTSAPTEQQKAEAMKELVALGHQLGVGPGNWVQLYETAKQVGGWVWENYLNLVSAATGIARDAIANQGAARRQLPAYGGQ